MKKLFKETKIIEADIEITKAKLNELALKYGLEPIKDKEKV